MPPCKRQQLAVAAAFQTVPLHPPPPLPPVSLALDDDDLLMEILVRLPAKSLIRFKCVCKKWLSLISSDHLCHLHTLRRPKLQQSIILQTHSRGEFVYLNPTITNNDEKKMVPFSLSGPVPVPYCNIVQACNGLMLLKQTHSYDPTTKQFEWLWKCSYYVYNPTNRRSREIIPTYDDKRPYIKAIGIAFDPSKLPYYKIVSIRSIGESDSNLYKIEVYDSESHTWKLSLEPYIDNCPFNFSGTYGTYWNNTIYWRCNNGDNSYICFDIGKNQVKTLSFPVNRPVFDTYLQESDGHLYHFEYFKVRNWLESLRENDEELVTVSVWELVGHDDSQWIFKNYHRLTSTKDSDPYYMLRSVVGSGSGSGSGEDATCSLLTFGSGKMRAYRFLDKSYEDLLDFTTQPWYQPGYHKRLNVQCLQFGEVLALV